MVERICPRCEAGNPGEQAYCGDCGLRLQPGALSAAPSDSGTGLARRGATPLALRSVRLPAQWKQASKVVALGVASIAAEVGLAWLQQRHQAQQGQQLARPQGEAGRVLAVGRRIRTTWRNGQLYERVDEQVLWMAPDEPRR